jgi:hypothetical protein
VQLAAKSSSSEIQTQDLPFWKGRIALHMTIQAQLDYNSSFKI